mmetsp:Transcript_41092/g.92259  ORF Transcript_41092/g.92259 Transcript_41092/m.92259 type:complete len:510 (-) Transcript_41092:75-1604(-)
MWLRQSGYAWRTRCRIRWPSLAGRMASSLTPAQYFVPHFPADGRIEFITDVEGNWDYFCSLVARSSVLRWTQEATGTAGGSLGLVPNGYMVFGGDAPDKGPGDLRIVRLLVLLQRAHPERVFLLVGNRDSNKLRLAAELADGEMPHKDPVAYLDSHGWEGRKQQFADFLSEHALQQTEFNALRWILEKTMGARTAIHNRRAELQALGRPSNDADILRSFRDLVDPQAAEPWQLWYLQAAQVMVVIGDCVFVHGALRSHGLLLVPAEDCRDGASEGQPPPLRLPETTSLEDWAEELNQWKARQLRLFEAFPRFVHDGSMRWRGGMPLMMPSLVGCRVMIDGFLQGGNCAVLEPDVAAYLARHGIRRVFTGHQPVGQSPAVMRTGDIVVMAADTSFSDPTAAATSTNPADCRGRALSTVTIDAKSIEVSGILSDGTEHGFRISMDEDPANQDARFIGRRFADQSWGRTMVEGQVQTCRGEGFDLLFNLLPPSEAAASMNHDAVQEPHHSHS